MNPVIRNRIIDYLYDHVEINHQRYSILKNASEIYDLRNKQFYISANSCGINSFIIFMKHNSEYYSYIVDRRSISYNRHTVNKNNVKMFEIKLKVDEKYYNGTILDGIWMDNLGLNNSTIHFMITDVFMLFGKSTMIQNYASKMFTLHNLMNELPKDVKYKLYVSRPYNLNDAKSLFTEYIYPNIKNFNIKGITYYPECSGTKLIYLFDKEDEQYKNLLFANSEIKTEIKLNEPEEITSNQKRVYKFELIDFEYSEKVTHTFEVLKTDTPDVYKLYSFFQTTNNNKKFIGIAYIPTYNDSLKCKTLFLNSNTLIMECVFYPMKGKWIPNCISENQKIDIINKSEFIKVQEEIVEIVEN